MTCVKHRKPTVSPLPQATSPTRPCPPQGSCHGSKESSVTPTTLVFNTPPVVNLLAWCPTTTTQCKHHPGLVEGGHFKPEVLNSYETSDLRQKGWLCSRVKQNIFIWIIFYWFQSLSVCTYMKVYIHGCSTQFWVLYMGILYGHLPTSTATVLYPCICF